jgi:integrase
VAGLRISEVLKLEQPDVDLGEGILTIRQTKFGKTRLVPLHTSTRDVMAD